MTVQILSNFVSFTSKKVFLLKVSDIFNWMNASLGLNNDKKNLKDEPKEPRLILNLSVIEKE